MTFPPSLLRVRVQTHRRRVGLWIPLILIWPFVLLLGILLYPLVIVAAIIFWPRGWGRPILLLGPLLFGLFTAIRGLEVRVEQPSTRVLVSFR